jgi:hypothetical protein
LVVLFQLRGKETVKGIGSGIVSRLPARMPIPQTRPSSVRIVVWNAEQATWTARLGSFTFLGVSWSSKVSTLLDCKACVIPPKKPRGF